MIQPSHFHEMLVGNVVTSSHHARTMSPNFSLEKKKKTKEIRLREKGIEYGTKQWHP
jgi:hypothetical protein